MSDYGSDIHTRNRRWLPTEPNRYPTSPTIPVAKLRLFKELNQQRAGSTEPSRSITRASSVSPIPPAPMDRVTLSYPGTPIKHSNGYLLHQSSVGSGSVYPTGRPSSITFHPSVTSGRYSPETYVPNYLGNRSSYTTDRYYPASLSGSGPLVSSGHHHHSSSSHHQRDLLSTSPSALARRNIALPINRSTGLTGSSTISGSGSYYRRSPDPYSGDPSLRDQIKNGLRYFADERKRLVTGHHHSGQDLRYNTYSGAGTGSSYPYPTPGPSLLSGTGLAHSSHLGQLNPTTGPRSTSGYPHHSAYTRSHRHHRSESDLDALYNLYSYPPDPVLDRRPPPGVARVGSGPLINSPSLAYHQHQHQLQRNASYPSIIPGSTPTSSSHHLSNYPHHHYHQHSSTSAYPVAPTAYYQDPYQRSTSPYRYAQQAYNYQSYGTSSAAAAAAAASAAQTTHHHSQRYNNSRDRYY